jgi:SAM-dependent methyltransferase
MPWMIGRGSKPRTRLLKPATAQRAPKTETSGRRLIASFPRPVLRLLKGVRAAGLVGLGPIDYVSRVIEGRSYLPPLRVRSLAGPLSGLEPSGAEFLAYLKLLCGATPSARVLDIGCGFGLLGLQLKKVLHHPGRYVGVDVDRRAIGWANRHVASQNAAFEFLHLDLRNAAYNPRGAEPAADLHLPLPSASFDIIVLKSVFTHLRPDEVRNYLAEASRLLDRGGVCLGTFFLLNEAQQRLYESGHNGIDFRFGDGPWRYAVREMPELAVAYREDELQRMIAEANLRATQTYYGTWCGRPDGLSYQDMLLLSPA